MKKYVFLLSVLLLLFLGVIITHNISSLIDKKSDTTNIDFTLFPFNNIDFVYSQTGITAEKLITQFPWSWVAVNSTYFGYDENKDFVPAGIYIHNWIQYADFVQPLLDRNLSISLAYLDETIRLGDATNNIISWASRQAQAGPILIKHWIINNELQEKHSHWQWRYYRTVLILDWEDEKKKYIWVSKTPVSLFDLAAYINKNICTDACDVVNLDGWPSSSYLKFWEVEWETWSMWFRTWEKLPFWLILRQ